MSRGFTYIPIEEAFGWIFDLSNFVVTPSNRQITVIGFLMITSPEYKFDNSIDIRSDLSVTDQPKQSFSWSLIPHIYVAH